jgi:hypothetical protein
MKSGGFPLSYDPFTAVYGAACAAYLVNAAVESAAGGCLAQLIEEVEQAVGVHLERKRLNHV